MVKKKILLSGVFAALAFAGQSFAMQNGQNVERERELLNEQWVREHTKSCPRCKVKIEKLGGCNHMRCAMCGFQFCWNCLKEWNFYQSRYPHYDFYTCPVDMEREAIIEKSKENFFKNLNLKRDVKREDGRFGKLSDVTIKCLLLQK